MSIKILDFSKTLLLTAKNNNFTAMHAKHKIEHLSSQEQNNLQNLFFHEGISAFIHDGKICTSEPLNNFVNYENLAIKFAPSFIQYLKEETGFETLNQGFLVKRGNKIECHVNLKNPAGVKRYFTISNEIEGQYSEDNSLESKLNNIFEIATNAFISHNPSFFLEEDGFCYPPLETKYSFIGVALKPKNINLGSEEYITLVLKNLDNKIAQYIQCRPDFCHELLNEKEIIIEYQEHSCKIVIDVEVAFHAYRGGENIPHSLKNAIAQVESDHINCNYVPKSSTAPNLRGNFSKESLMNGSNTDPGFYLSLKGLGSDTESSTNSSKSTSNSENCSTNSLNKERGDNCRF